MAAPRKPTCTDKPKRIRKPKTATPEGLPDSCRGQQLPEFPEWAEAAWRLYCRGQRNWSSLARTFGVKDYRTVQAAVGKFGAAVRAAGSGSGVDAWQEALTAQEEVLSEAWRIEADATATNGEKVAALKVAQTAIEQIAALNGVVTKRSSHELTGAGGGPVDVKQSGRIELAGDVALAVVEFHQEAKADGSDSDAEG